MFNQNRSNVEIAADILRLKGSQTAIMYGANLSHGQTLKYLSYLTDSALIKSVGGKDGRQRYHRTRKGQEFIELVEKLDVLLGSSSIKEVRRDVAIAQ